MSLLLLALYYYGLLVCAQHITLPCSGATVDTIPRGRALAGDERLVSGNGKFALGFFQTGNNNKSSSSSKSNNNITRNSYLGIWFHRITKLTPVWTANGNNPIPSLASPELMISGDGNLVLLAQGKIVWSTRANITTGASDTVAVLLGNGNLVLRSSSNSSDVFWQSFDYPTDTLLSGAKIGLNKITGLNRRIVSRKSTVDQSSGAYSAELAHRAIHILWKSSVVYWSSGEWTDRFFSSIPEMAARNSGPYISNYTFVDNEQEVYFSYTLLDETMIFHNFVGPSGQMQTNIWSDVAQDWIIAATQPKDPCDVYATCGPFTVCANHGDATCNCMKGFSVRSPEDWEHQDRTGGCIRHAPLNCDGGGGDGKNNKTGMTTDKFYSVPSIRLPQNARRIQNASSANGCAQACLSNCSCTAYSYGVGGCSVWHGELLNVAADDNGGTLYLRLAAEELARSSKSKKRGVIIGVAVGATTVTVVGFIALLITAIWKRRIGEWTRSRTVDNDNQRDIGIISFRYIDLERATKNFSEKIGEGGFGSVFKGCLWDARAIAVKMLVGASQGEKQFRAEVNSIGIVRHINLVELIGYCCDGGRRLLAYEYMSNGSLDTLLFQNQCRVLDWTIRYQIALGVARGLAYLHHGCRDCIIHCDIKPQNILLDTSFVPKIADFGMAKFLGRDFSRVVTTTRGTIGYLAPEWISGTAITSKVDVYSYGMVLLEIISGRRNNDNECSHDGDHTYYFPVQVAHKLLDGDVESILDGNLNGDVNLEEVERVCKIACWCIQDNEFDRPNMSEVVHFLEGVLEPEMPPVPRLLDAITRGSYLA